VAPRRRVTKEMIVGEARRLVAEQGTTGLTFQALASALGVSKQAIIYWYPSKRELARDFCLPLLKEERDVVTTAIADSGSASEAIESFVRSLVRYHLLDLGRFRILYLWLQFEPGVALRPGDEYLLDPIHETTSSSYDLLEAMIAADRSFLGNGDARKLAVAVDMAALGLITMIAMAEAMNDPWRHSTDLMVDALVDLLTGKHRSDATKSI
jgi:AcrR family transcriptional regulator